MIYSSQNTQRGFTLVELAIVLIIIGLLIGGVLQGREFINNAKVVNTAAAIEGYRGAYQAFIDAYNAIPGDIVTVGRIPNCTAAPCSTAGDGSNILGVGAAGITPGELQAANEATRFWVHLAMAGFITNIQNVEGTYSFETNLPPAKIGGGFIVGYIVDDAIFRGQIPGGSLLGGTYFHLRSRSDSDSRNPNVHKLSASLMARLDRKMDDGAPSTGAAIGVGAKMWRAQDVEMVLTPLNTMKPRTLVRVVFTIYLPIRTT